MPRLLITSRRLPLYTGGLASYQKQLAEELSSRHQISVGFLAAGAGPESPGPPVLLPGPSASWNVLKRKNLWMRLASRPLLHPLLQLWISTCFGRQLKASALPIPRPDVIHFVGTGWDFAGFGFHHLARSLGARFTIWPAVHPGEWGDDAIDRRLYRLADAVFCQSEYEAAHLERGGLDSSKIVRCGLPPMCLPGRDGQVLRKALGMGERPVVLFLGRRDEGKGYPALLTAWQKVLVRHPEALLMLSGPGGEEFRGLRDRLPAESFRDLGIADEETKAQALAACDVFCLPSTHESFGIVFVEAWSYAKPVICGPAPASRELIRDGQTGLHADQNPDSIAAALDHLLCDTPMRVSLGNAGLEFQQSALTWDIISKIHREAFRFRPKNES